MAKAPRSYRPGGRRSQADLRRDYDNRRGTAASRGYDGKWRKARDGYLTEHPLCVMCEQVGQVTAATVVDHIVPHRGDLTLFWRRSNWQPLCKPHHDGPKQADDRRRRV